MEDNHRRRALDNFLPHELILQILYRLPPKTLLRCTSVCKSWYSLIKSTDFISAHLNHTLNFSSSDDPLFFSNGHGDKPSYDGGPLCYALDFGTKHFNQRDMKLLDFPVDYGDQPHRLEVVSICRGLVCLVDYPNSAIVLWNPCIKRSVIVYYPFVEYQVIGLGFASNSNDYKLLRYVESDDEDRLSDLVDDDEDDDDDDGFNIPQKHFQLYSLNEDSWIDITNLAPSYFKRFYFNNGWVHCGTNFLNCIIAEQSTTARLLPPHAILGFDLNQEVFREISLPQGLLLPISGDFSLMEYGTSSLGLVCRVDDQGYDVWVMKEYGVAESWTKLFRITDTEHRLRGLMFRKNGELLVRRLAGKVLKIGNRVSGVINSFIKDIVSCDPRTYQTTHLAEVGKGSIPYVSSFVQSLVLLDLD